MSGSLISLFLKRGKVMRKFSMRGKARFPHIVTHKPTKSINGMVGNIWTKGAFGSEQSFVR